MEAIIIKKKTFDNLFKQALEKIQLDRAISDEKNAQYDNTPIGELYRLFHYEVSCLKDKLEEAEY